MAQWDLLNSVSENTNAVQHIAFSPSGDYLAVASGDQNCYVYDTTDFSLTATLTQAGGALTSVDFSPDGNWITYGSLDNNAYVHAVGGSWTFETTLSQASNNVVSVAWGPNSLWVAYGTIGNSVYTHDATNSWASSSTLTQATDTVTGIDFSTSDPDIAYSSDDGNVYIHSRGGAWGFEESLTRATSGVTEVAYSSTGAYIAYASDDNSVYVDNAAPYSSATSLTQATAQVEGVGWDPDNDWIAYGGSDNNVYVHAVGTWGLETTLTQASSKVYSVAWTPVFVAYSTNNGTSFVHTQEVPVTVAATGQDADLGSVDVLNQVTLAATGQDADAGSVATTTFFQLTPTGQDADVGEAVTVHDNWRIGSNIVTEDVAETVTDSSVTLAFRVSTATLETAIRPLKRDEGKVDLMRTDDGGFVSVDRADGNNTVTLTPPIHRDPLRFRQNAHVYRYEESLVSQSVDEWDVELEFTKAADRTDSPSLNEIKSGAVFDWIFPKTFDRRAGWEFITRYGSFVTDRVNAELLGTGADGVERFELTTRLRFEQAHVFESALSLLGGTRVKSVPDAPNQIVDETSGDANTVTVDAPDSQTVVSDGQYVVTEWESERINDDFQTVSMVLAKV